MIAFLNFLIQGCHRPGKYGKPEKVKEVFKWSRKTWNSEEKLSYDLEDFRNCRKITYFGAK